MREVVTKINVLLPQAKQVRDPDVQYVSLETYKAALEFSRFMRDLYAEITQTDPENKDHKKILKACETAVVYTSELVGDHKIFKPAESKWEDLGEVDLSSPRSQRARREEEPRPKKGARFGSKFYYD
jgi:hypothetical protein